MNYPHWAFGVVRRSERLSSTQGLELVVKSAGFEAFGPDNVASVSHDQPRARDRQRSYQLHRLAEYSRPGGELLAEDAERGVYPETSPLALGAAGLARRVGLQG